MKPYEISNILLSSQSALKGDTLVATATVQVESTNTNLSILFQIVDENYNQIAVRSFDGVNFSAGQLRTFMPSLVLPATLPNGTYYLSVGVFNSSYSQTLAYVNRALKITVIP